MFSLLVGFATGLSRMGWDLNILPTSLHHGAIMVGGFLGTLISLEKIIPLKKKLLFLIPVFSGASVISFFTNAPTTSFLLLVLASSGLSGVFLTYYFKEKSLIYLLMLAGSLCWLTGNLVLITINFYPSAFPWWLAFILLIITAERLEMTRFLPVKERSKRWLVFFLVLYIAGVLLSFHSGGDWVSGMALIAVSLWLMQHDIIGISIKKSGLPKFIAIALLTGYISMLFTGVFLIAFTNQVLAYDAILHTFFLGFVFSMIFAHGPVILPGVLGIAVKPYHNVLYMWLFLLHASWITRIAADLLLHFDLRKMSGLVSTVCILGYFATVATLTIKQMHRHAKVL